MSSDTGKASVPLTPKAGFLNLGKGLFPSIQRPGFLNLSMVSIPLIPKFGIMDDEPLHMRLAAEFLNTEKTAELLNMETEEFLMMEIIYASNVQQSKILSTTKKGTIYATIDASWIQFLGFSEVKARPTAEKMGLDIYHFDTELIRQWRGMTSRNAASRGMVSLTLEEAKALKIIGKKAPIPSISLAVQMRVTLAVERLMSPENRQKLKNMSDGTMIELVENESTNQTSKILEFIKKQVEQPSQNSEEEILHIVLEMFKKDEDVIASGNMLEHVMQSLESAAESVLNDLDKTDKNTLPSDFKKDIRDNSEKSEIVNKVLRANKRFEIYKFVQKNDEEGLGYTEREIAKMFGSGKTLVNKMSQLYSYHQRDKDKDQKEKEKEIWESKRGPKPNPFRIISSEIYKDLCIMLQTQGPKELNLPYFSWSAAAIFFYLETRGIHVKLNYIYDICHKLGITSKFASRKNPKENSGEVDYFLNIRYPEICRRAVKEGKYIVFEDECHVLIYPHFQGYSLVNSASICSFDQSLEHSEYSVISFIGLDGSKRVFLIKGTVDSEKYVECLEKFKKENSDKKIILFTDNSPVHTSYESLGWFIENKNRFEIYFLPRYCPRMNVVEFFNNIFKKELKKTSVMSTTEMIAKASAICNKYNTNSEDVTNVIKSLFFKEECSYAKVTFDKEKELLTPKQAVTG